MTPKRLHLIGAEVGEGASDGGCKWGAQALCERGLAQALTATGRVSTWGDTVTAQPLHASSRLDAVEVFSRQLAVAVERALRQGHQPLVVGGDHSCAAGTWSAVAQFLRPVGALGLIWIDAHLDAHTPQTSDSQAPHGMPLAALLGHGSEGMAGLYGWRGKLLPSHVVVIGARSYEPAEAELLAALQVRVMTMEEVLDRSFAACFDAGSGWSGPAGCPRHRHTGGERDSPGRCRSRVGRVWARHRLHRHGAGRVQPAARLWRTHGAGCHAVGVRRAKLARCNLRPINSGTTSHGESKACTRCMAMNPCCNKRRWTPFGPWPASRVLPSAPRTRWPEPTLTGAKCWRRAAR